MGNFRVRRCHKCKYTLKSKNLVQLKDGKPLCDIYKNGIPDETFFKGKYCSKFELAYKYNIVRMIENLIEKFKNRKSPKVKNKDNNKKSRVISINKNAN